MPPLVPLFHLFIRLNRRKIVDILVEHWRRDPPDMVVCMIPHFIKPMWQALQQVDPDIPFVTIMTDMANLPGFWFADVPHHLLCGSEKSYRQALAAYGPSDRVRQVNGMILRPEFYSGRTVDVAAYRESIGLCPVTTTGLIMFGAQGSSDTLELIEELERSDIELQLIVLCGHNQKLLDKLNRRGSSRVKVVARAFTDEIATLMQAADFMVGKPGPASISEAVASNLPPVVLANRGMLPQERYKRGVARGTGTRRRMPLVEEDRPGGARCDRHQARTFVPDQMRNRAQPRGPGNRRNPRFAAGRTGRVGSGRVAVLPGPA